MTRINTLVAQIKGQLSKALKGRITKLENLYKDLEAAIQLNETESSEENAKAVTELQGHFDELEQSIADQLESILTKEGVTPDPVIDPNAPQAPAADPVVPPVEPVIPPVSPTPVIDPNTPPAPAADPVVPPVEPVIPPVTPPSAPPVPEQKKKSNAGWWIAAAALVAVVTAGAIILKPKD